MLELIVLGQVPGTHIQITFFQVLVLGELFILVLATIHEVRIRRNLVRRFITITDIKKLLKV